MWTFLVLSAIAMQRSSTMPPLIPSAGFVPDHKTAIRIAEAVLIPVYGEQQIIHERPFHAKLVKNVWYVRGSLPKRWAGGVPEIEISKSDGRILYVMHGR